MEKVIGDDDFNYDENTKNVRNFDVISPITIPLKI